MGMVISFYRVTPEEYARVVDDPGCADEIQDVAYEREKKKGSPDGYLDKAWDGIEYLLRAAEVSVRVYEDDYVFLGKDGCLFGWDEDDVAEAAKVLRATPFTELARHYDPVRMTEQDVYPSVIWLRDGDEALDYLRYHYEVLVAFFDDAASRGCAAIKYFG